MSNVVKEIVERITLVDILREAREADVFLKTLQEDKKFQFNIRYLTRAASRVMLRAAGDIGAAIGVYAASADPEHVVRDCTAGFAGMILIYTLDYVIYDYLRPNFLKKNDPQ